MLKFYYMYIYFENYKLLKWNLFCFVLFFSLNDVSELSSACKYKTFELSTVLFWFYIYIYIYTITDLDCFMVRLCQG